MKRLYFFQCQEDYNRSMYLPYSSGILWAYVRQNANIRQNYNLGDIFFEKLPVEDYINKLEEPDIALFSNYGWNTAYHLEVAKKIKEKWPQCIIVIGGPNAQQEKEYLLTYDFVDISVWGEGEQSLLELLLNIDDYQNVPGLAYIKQGVYIKTNLRNRQPNLQEIPSPYLDGIFDDFFERYDYNFMPVWETNRGCPYHCTFCDLGADYYNKLHTFSTDRLLKEIDWFVDKKIEYVEIADANFGILERDLDLVKHIKQKNLETGFPKKINATWAKNSPARVFEMSKILDSINRGGVTLALQSSNKIALNNIKRFNIVNEKLEQVAKKYIENGIQTYHDFILGLPGETLDSWCEGLLQIIDINPEGWIFGHPLEAYKNTEFSDPNYIKNHQLKFAKTPQVSFFAHRKTDIPIEYGNYVVAHSTMNFDDYIEGFLFKWFIISMHSLGWFNPIATEISRQSNLPLSKIYKSLYHWVKNSDGLINSQYQYTGAKLIDTLTNSDFWGVQIFGPEDVYWEYESASCIFYEKNREQYFRELKIFLEKYYATFDADKLIAHNKRQLVAYQKDLNFKNFCIETYWYGRRRKAWRVNEQSKQ